MKTTTTQTVEPLKVYATQNRKNFKILYNSLSTPTPLRVKTPIRSLQLNTNPLTATLKVPARQAPNFLALAQAIKSKENTIIPRFSLWWHLLSENAKWIYFHSSPSLPKALSEIHKSQQIVCLFKTKGNGSTWLQETHFTVTTGKSHDCKRRGFYLFLCVEE